MIEAHFDGIVLGMPAIEIGDHGDGCIGNLGLAGEFCLRHGGHADDVEAVRAVGHRIRHRRRIAALPCRDKCRLSRSRYFPRRRRRRFCARSKGAVGCAIETWATQPLPKKEEALPKVRSTNWSTITKRPGGSSGLSEPQAEIETRSVTPERFMRVDIGPIVDARGRERMAAPMAGQEHRFGRSDVVRIAAHPKDRPRVLRSVLRGRSPAPANHRRPTHR